MKGIGDRTAGLTMETPKGLAKALVERAIENPGLHLRVRRYGQLPGTFARSQPVLFPLENTYRSFGFAPWWFFGGFREVALGAMFYHEVVSPFRVNQTFRDFMSPTVAGLTLEQHSLRQQQDGLRRALASPSRSRGARQQRLIEADAAVFRRLRAIRRAKQDELERVFGSRAQRESLATIFRSRVRQLAQRLPVPGALDQRLADFEPDGTLSPHLIGYLEERG